MAKIQFGAVATDARGKIAGIVYSKNKAGNYVRAKVSPSQTESNRRTFVRSLFSVNARNFSTGISLAQVTAWNEFARGHLVTDVFGAAHALSGIQMYQRLNSIIAQAGGTPIEDPPDSLAITALLTMVATVTAGAPDVVSIAFTPSPPEASHKIAVYATKPLPTGRTFSKSDKRFVFLSASAAASPAVVSAPYLAEFGALTAGLKVGIWIQKINILTGAQTLPLYKLVTIA